MKSKTKPYDLTKPEARALIDEIVHGAFLREGTMVAFPTCFPGATIPFPSDESRITALAVGTNGIVYGGTSGRRTHLFYAIFHGATGALFDMGTVENGDHCAAVCCDDKRFVACVNGPTGGRVLARPVPGMPFDLLQEWGFRRIAFEDLASLPSERILHALPDGTGGVVILTDKHLATLAADGKQVEMVGEVAGRGRMGAGSRGGMFGLDGTTHLWRYAPASRKLDRESVRLPDGAWEGLSPVWARDSRSAVLYTGDAEGRLFAFHEDRGFDPCVGRVPLAPVGPMAVTFDGRVFGFCGDGIGRLFCYDPSLKRVDDLGVAVSTLQRRRYGYAFGDAVTGRDGQIVFGEDDDLGHLWLYFPRIRDGREEKA